LAIALDAGWQANAELTGTQRLRRFVPGVVTGYAAISLGSLMNYMISLAY